MAFALSVKSKMDFPRVGGIFIVLTLIITIFTLFYASLLLEPTLHFCQNAMKNFTKNTFDQTVKMPTTFTAITQSSEK